MTDPWKFNHMNIILGTGEWDNTRHESFRLSAILTRERHPALARRPPLVRTRLELLARHAALLSLHDLMTAEDFAPRYLYKRY